MTILKLEIPESVKISKELTREEKPIELETHNPHKTTEGFVKGDAFHKKSEKNSKTNQGGSYRRELAKKYKKPKTRGDKNYNKKRRR